MGKIAPKKPVEGPVQMFSMWRAVNKCRERILDVGSRVWQPSQSACKDVRRAVIAAGRSCPFHPASKEEW